MGSTAKTTQLQVRVSAEQKRVIARAAKRAGLGMSAYVLERALGVGEHRVGELMRRLGNSAERSYALAELHDVLVRLGVDELRRALGDAPLATLDPESANYAAAMIETAFVRAGIEAPAWTRASQPLITPLFGSKFESLRLHLLANSPPAFRRRSIFIDTTLGGRV